MRRYGDKGKKHGNENTEELSSRRNHRMVWTERDVIDHLIPAPCAGHRVLCLMTKDEMKLLSVVI